MTDKYKEDLPTDADMLKDAEFEIKRLQGLLEELKVIAEAFPYTSIGRSCRNKIVNKIEALK